MARMNRSHPPNLCTIVRSDPDQRGQYKRLEMNKSFNWLEFDLNSHVRLHEGPDLEFKSVPYYIELKKCLQQIKNEQKWTNACQIGDLLRDVQTMVNARQWSGRPGFIILGVAEGKTKGHESEFDHNTIVGLDSLWIPKKLQVVENGTSTCPSMDKARIQYIDQGNQAIELWKDVEKVRTFLNEFLQQYLEPMPEVDYSVVKYSVGDRGHSSNGDDESKTVGVIAVSARQSYPTLVKAYLSQHYQRVDHTFDNRITEEKHYRVGEWYERVGRNIEPIFGKKAVDRVRRKLTNDVFEVSGAYLVAVASLAVAIYVLMQLAGGWCIRALRDRCHEHTVGNLKRLAVADQYHIAGMYLLVIVANIVLLLLALYWKSRLPSEFKIIARLIIGGLLTAIGCWIWAAVVDARVAYNPFFWW